MPPPERAGGRYHVYRETLPSGSENPRGAGFADPPPPSDDERPVVFDYCAVASSLRARRRTLSLERVRKLVDKGFTEVYLTGGEPFVHPDIVAMLEDASDRLDTVAAAWRNPTLAGGNFALRFEGDDLFARSLTATYAAQHRLGYFYGDSSIFARREAFEALPGAGGHGRLRLRAPVGPPRRLACLPGRATTSSRRWRRLGVVRTVLFWVVIRWLFVLKVPPQRFARLYCRAR